MRLRKHPINQDPSPREQYFAPLVPRIHCCREWRITSWNIAHFRSPYWRLYWNREPKGILRHDGRTIQLGPDKVVLVAPETDFSGEFNAAADDGHRFELIGGPKDEAAGMPEGAMTHLFIHFNLGPGIDFLQDRIFELPVDPEQQESFGAIGLAVTDDPEFPDLALELRILSLVSSSVARALSSMETLPIGDARISRVLEIIESDLSAAHSNSRLAGAAMLSLSRFEKLFTELVGQSPGRYVNARRIEEACILLDHGEDALEGIAEHLGFYDRHHFSKVFKKYRGVSPATYRKAGIHGVGDR